MPAPELIQQKELLQQETDSTDRAIGRLAYELSHKGMVYGLSEEEIRMVEDGNS